MGGGEEGMIGRGGEGVREGGDGRGRGGDDWEGTCYEGKEGERGNSPIASDHMCPATYLNKSEG